MSYEKGGLSISVDREHVRLNFVIKHSGMLIGGYTWGSLADVLGRKSTLMTAMLFNGICGLVSSLSPNFLFFLFFRLASGIGYVESS